MPRYDDHTAVTELLKDAQEAEHDSREKAREVDAFLHLPDGQWEESVYNRFNEQGRPRYTFDRTNDIVDDVAGEIEQAEFAMKASPAGGGATDDLADTYDGMFRNIQNLSSASETFSASARRTVERGFDCWRLVQRWGDNNTFDQDLYIDPVVDALDRVWFDPTSFLPTREDARYCFLLHAISRDEYKDKFPKGSEQSIDTESRFDAYGNKPDTIMVGQIFYKSKAKTEIVEMSNGSVYVVDDKFEKIRDELERAGVTVKRERSRDIDQIKKRFFDGGGWLTDVEDTVFEFLPIIPEYANFSVSKNKVRYWGIATKKMDAQRVYNYVESRKVEESALAPLDKIIHTAEQVEGHEEQWRKLNVSKDPALQYNHVDNVPSPYKIGGAQVNAGLETVSASMVSNLQSTAGLDQISGQPLGLQSGRAVELKQNKGDTRNYKYTSAHKRAIQHTAKVLSRAIPKVYDTERQVRILNENDSSDIVTVNQQIVDEQTNQPVTVNDLSQGIYDVTCSVGPAFKNRQEETSQSFSEMVERDPTILELGRDIWLKNLNSPGMDTLADRARRQMLLSGGIPEEEMTEEEIEFLQNQPEPPPDPVAEALQREADNADDELELKGIIEARKDREMEHKQTLDEIKVLAEVLGKHADTLNAIREAVGVDAIVAPDAVKAFTEQAGLVRETQAEQP